MICEPLQHDDGSSRFVGIYMGNGSSYTPPAGACLSVLLVELAIITILQHAMQLQV